MQQSGQERSKYSYVNLLVERFPDGNKYADLQGRLPVKLHLENAIKQDFIKEDALPLLQATPRELLENPRPINAFFAPCHTMNELSR